MIQNRPLIRLSPHQLTAGGGQQENDYVLDRPPYTRYVWDGQEFKAIADDSLTEPTLARWSDSTGTALVDPQGREINMAAVRETFGGAQSESASDTFPGSAAGPLGGRVLPTGQTWSLGGAGYLTTAINAGGWVEGTLNTYCRVNTGAPVYRYVQRYQGNMATLACMAAEDISIDMLHVNFNSAGVVNFSYWKDSATTEGLQMEQQIATLPDFDDNAPHDFEIVIDGNTCLAYMDGTLYAIAYDTNISDVVGNWVFAQIHEAAGEKIFGVWTYSRESAAAQTAFVSRLDAVEAKSLAGWSVRLGKPTGTNFAPSSDAYYYTDDDAGHVFHGSGHSFLNVVANTGYDARITLTSFLGNQGSIVANGTGNIEFRRGTEPQFQLPFNTNRVDMLYPMKLPTYTVSTLPSASTYTQCLIYVSNGTSNKRLAVSDGTNWRWPDGAIVS